MTNMKHVRGVSRYLTDHKSNQKGIGYLDLNGLTISLQAKIKFLLQSRRALVKASDEDFMTSI